jgi:phenylalanyl-tRNA synthetase beta chain
VAALSGAALRIPEPAVPEEGEPIAAETSVEIRAPELCHRYAARIVRGVHLGASPQWMRQRLEVAGVRAINNVVDVTNYVLLELGHPLHAFDLQRLAGERIVVQRARDGERFSTLDGQERVVDSETLMIGDAERHVALAGVMGGLNSEVQADTVDILLESAFFLPQNIRRTSKRLGLRTEASYRFERGTDVEGLIRALDRATELIVQLAGGTASRGIWDAYPIHHGPHMVALRVAKVAAVLGVEIPRETVAGHLQALGMGVVDPGEDRMDVEIPTHRVDLEREIDLVEEVARLEGYDSIPVTLPEVPMVCEPVPRTLRIADGARDALVGAGLLEAVNWSFVDPSEDDRLGYSEDSPLRAKVHLQNPLNTETGVLRTSLLPGLLRNAGLNARRQARDVRLFEVGRTFHPDTDHTLPREVLRAAGVLTGKRQPLAWWAEAEVVDYYDAKGVVEMLLQRLGAGRGSYEADPDLPWLHPARAARLLLQGNECGWLGQIHPDRLEIYEIPAPAVAFEVNLERVSQAAEGVGRFAGLERFPSVERDVAVVVDRTVTAQTVLDSIDSFGSPLIRTAALFDVFEGGRVPEGRVSLAFRVVYRSDERTLTEEEVSEVENALLRRLEERVGASLRKA